LPGVYPESLSLLPQTGETGEELAYHAFPLIFRQLRPKRNIRGIFKNDPGSFNMVDERQAANEYG
jgi:hypothetical protein